MDRHVFLVLLVTLLPIAATVTADSAYDAGLGVDASDSSASPSALPGFGSYGGVLTHDDAGDWYAVATSSEPSCFALDSFGSPDISVTFALRGTGFDHGIRTGLSTSSASPTRIVLAGSGVSSAVAGFTPNAVWTTSHPYTFTMQNATASSGGSSSLPTPAGLLASPAPLPGSCVSGHLNPLAGVGHTTDAYSIQGVAGQQVYYSLGATTSLVQVQLLAPNGTAAGPAIATDGLALVTLPSTGTYTLTAMGSGTSAIDYVVAFVGDPSGCKPNCVAV